MKTRKPWPPKTDLFHQPTIPAVVKVKEEMQPAVSSVEVSQDPPTEEIFDAFTKKRCIKLNELSKTLKNNCDGNRI
ncbi:MAG: hypothetical protein WCP32_10300 [Bacteroidota bacterium]